MVEKNNFKVSFLNMCVCYLEIGEFVFLYLNMLFSFRIDFSNELNYVC